MKRLRMMITGILLLSTPLLSVSPAQAAGQSEVLELSIEDAVSLGMVHSRDLEKSEMSTELARLNYNDTSISFDNFWDEEYGSSEEESTEEDISEANRYYQKYSSMLNAEHSYSSSRLSEDVTRDQVIFNIHEKYYSVLQAIGSLEQAEMELSLQEQKFRLSQALYRMGRLSAMEFQEATMQLKNQKSNLTTAQNNLDEAYYNFNLLVGLDPADRPILIEEPQLEVFEVQNIDSRIRSLAASTPEQWLKEKSLEIKAELSGWSESDEQGEIELDMASLDVSELKEKTIQQLHNTYTNIKSVEKQVELAEENLALLQTRLRQAKMYYQVGRGTHVDILSAQLDLIQAEQNLLKLICQHNLLKMNFSLPWTM